MNLDLKQKRRIILAFAAVGIILALIATFFFSDVTGLVQLILILTLLGYMGMNFCWLRCPYCGAWLGRNGGDFCASCGEKLDR